MAKQIKNPGKLIETVTADHSEASRLAADVENARLRSEIASIKSKYKSALHQIEIERERADTVLGLTGLEAKKLPNKPRRTKKHQATAIIGLSDWHVEELVRPETVNNLNNFNLEICDKRINELSERCITILEHERDLVEIDRVVVWLGGDFITGHIHEDCAELAQLAPLPAKRWAGERIRGFIDNISELANEVVVVTNSGNHGRSTPKLRIGTELDHSFEQDLYLTLATNEKRNNIRWQVTPSHLSNLNLDGFKIRFLHGHSIRYQGGIGGITIPVNKAIAAWDKIEQVDLTMFGHWHQWSWLRAGKYVSNGSLIGHSAYAVAIKAAYEPPCQSFVVVDHERNEVTKAIPVFCDKDLRKNK